MSVADFKDPRITNLLKQQPQLRATLERWIVSAEGKLTNVFASIKGNHCSGCNLVVATSKLCKIRDGKLIRCDNCSRFLYFEASSLKLKEKQL